MPLEIAEAQEHLGGGEDGSMLQGLLTQSTAITTLVSHLVQGGSSDPLLDLSMPNSSAGSRGAIGRAKLQAELASKKGLFFSKVMQAAARRMDPTQACDIEPSELKQQGLSMAKYVERFGGYGQVRSIALIQWQVCLALDQALSGHMDGCLDILSLLCVCLEHASLDNGNFDIGYLMTLQEEPPAAIMSNRSVMSVGGRARAFAPLADQRWVTTSLAYLRELDLITQKRADALSDLPPAPKLSEEEGGWKKKKPKAKGKWQKKQE